MSQETNRVLREISDLTRNMDGLFRELKETNENTKKFTQSVDNVAKGLEDGKKPADSLKQESEQMFKSFAESFMKSFNEQNKNIVDTLSKSLGDSVSEFAKSIPNQIASVKSDIPVNYESLLGDSPIKGIVSGIASKIPGLKRGGRAGKGGLAVVGENGPEVVNLNAGDVVTSNEKLNETLGAKPREDRESQIPLARQATSIIDNDDTRREFLQYARTELDRSERAELASDEDEFIDHFKYWNEFVRGRETMTLEDVAKLGTPVVSPDNIKTSEVEESISSNKSKREERREGRKAERQERRQNLKDKIKSGAEGIISQVAPPELKDIMSKVKKTEESPGTDNTGAQAPPSASTIQKSPDALSEITALTEKLKAKRDSESSTDSPSTSNNTPSPTTSNTESTQSSVSSSRSNSDNSQVNALKEAISTLSPKDQSKDLGDIKALLGSIYKLLKGPISANRDEPYRPHSNQF